MNDLPQRCFLAYLVFGHYPDGNWRSDDVSKTQIAMLNVMLDDYEASVVAHGPYERINPHKGFPAATVAEHQHCSMEVGCHQVGRRPCFSNYGGQMKVGVYK